MRKDYPLFPIVLPEFLFMEMAHFCLYMKFLTFPVKFRLPHRTYDLICLFIYNPIAIFHFFQLCELDKQTVFFFCYLVRIIPVTAIVNLIGYNEFIVIVIIQDLWADKKIIEKAVFRFFFYLNYYSVLQPCIMIA